LENIGMDIKGEIFYLLHYLSFERFLILLFYVLSQHIIYLSGFLLLMPMTLFLEIYLFSFFTSF